MILSSDKVVKKMKCEGDNVDNDRWDDVLFHIEKLMGKHTHWYCEVHNFGWNSRIGHQTIEAKSPARLLGRILPDTECSLRIYKYGKNGIAINNAHHDSPMWAEWYYIVPFTKSIERQINA